MIAVTLPVLVALSWVPAVVNHARQVPPAPAPLKTDQPAYAPDTIECPITGERILSCCCPVKK